MRTAGIIAEYNPFHNGHLYQIEQTRALTGADFVVVAMSGDYVQRGEPAVYDKYTRTAMALNCGADLVLEIPVCFAAGSAEDFAAGSVSLLEKLGVTDFLCFGSELGKLDPLKEAADVLYQEPESYRTALKAFLKQGLSYPAARSEALARELKDSPDISLLLSAPNNILAVEYLKALKRQESSIEPVTIRRSGRGYGDSALPCDPEIFASATALRQAIREHFGEKDCDFFHGQTPAAAIQALAGENARIAPVFPDDLSPLLHYRLLELIKDNIPLSLYSDVSPELASRMERTALDFCTFSERIAQLKTRQYTYTRISRALLHVILGITADQMQMRRENGYASYARILGFKKSATPLLSQIKRAAAVPLVTKTADAAGFLSPAALIMLSEDMYASHVYQSLLSLKNRKIKNEYTKSVIVLP